MLPDLSIIALTLVAGDAYRRSVISAGADDLVHKVDLTTELLPAILGLKRMECENREV
jgi:DNA-binding NarL/FixJ family response regulator